MSDKRPSTTAPMLRQPALVVLGVMAALFLAFLLRASPLALDPVRTANPVGRFDTERAIARLSRILDGKPHGVDSAALDATRQRLLHEVEQIGYQPQLHDETACRGSISGSAIRCARVQNITFTAGPPPDAAHPALVLTAHYDSVDASPGAGDDGVGVAVWLEVAEQLKRSAPPRPVLFLLTDGEETALLGAQAFTDAKAYGYPIGRIINLEARGNRGPAMMFETSHPNEGVVTGWAKRTSRPVSNSMMTAAYELLPNSTDLTVYLRDGRAGINMAIADGLDFYHTAHDDLAHLDHRSVQHMGDQALGAATAYLADGDKPGAEIAYSDIGSRLFVTLPQQVALLLLGLCFGAAALATMSPARDISWKAFSWRIFALPPALIVAAGLVAFLSWTAIGLIRPEDAYWTAYGEALNSVIFIGALVAAALGLRFLARDAHREQVFASGWFWFLAVGLGLSAVVPGMAMVFLLPGLAFVVAAIVARLVPRITRWAHVGAGIFLMLVFLPLIHLVDVMMTLRLAPAFGVLEGLMLAPLLAVIGPIASGRRLVFPVLGGAWVVGAIATIVAPAYSAAHPLAVNIAAHYDLDEHKAQAAAAANPKSLPKAMKAMLDQAPAQIVPGVAAEVAYRNIAFTDPPTASASVVSDTMAGDKRTLVLRLSAPNARLVRLRIPAEAQPSQLQYERAPNPIAMREPARGYYVLDCVGRACDGASVTLTLAAKPAAPAQGAKPAPWTVQGNWAGLPPEAQAIADTRGDAALPIQTGDIVVTTKRFNP